MKTKLLLLIVAVGISTFMLSCKKTSTTTPVDEPSIEDMNVPNGFTFETTREVKLDIKMPKSVDFTELRSRFDVYTSNPAEGGTLINSGSFDENGEFSGVFRIPTALNEVYVKTIAGAVKVEVQQVSLKEDGVIIDFGDDYGFSEPDTTEPAAKKSASLMAEVYGQRDFNSVSSNIIANGDFETNDFGSIYYWNSTHPQDAKWYLTTYRSSMYQYNDNGNNVLRSPSGTNSFYGGASQFIDASPGDVVTFSADIKSVGSNNRLYAYLYIIPERANGSPLAYYNVRYLQPTNDWVNKQVVATMPNGTQKVKILVWYNDYSYSNNSSIMFDNVVVTGPVTDSDNDGVDDDLDDYPNDAARAFNVFYPNENDWGTLVYEDLWPGKGDYDFNDLVLDYHFKSVLSSENKLVEFFTDYSVRAVGASLENGFAFEIGGDPSNIASVVGNSLNHNLVNTNANGTEQGQTNTVVFLFDNSFDMIGSSGSTFINTQPTIPYVEPDTNTVHVLYATPVSVSVTGTAPYNPFLVAGLNKSRGTEVHLPGNANTDLADEALFGTWADDTNPANGKYYQTATNLPWALDIPESFVYPVEQVEIINAYNHFVEWAESGGSLYPDWYQDNSGYRNVSNIYSASN